MRKKLKIYVSGPYASPDQCVNTHNAIMAGNMILDAGHIPFIPHLSHLWHTVTPRPADDWMQIDMAFLPACDVLVRLPGQSPGGDQEVALAQSLHKMVFFGIDALMKFLLARADDEAVASRIESQSNIHRLRLRS